MTRPLLAPLLLFLSFRTALATVEETCGKATEGEQAAAAALNALCVASLRAVPRSGAADTHELAAAATRLTLANYTGAVAKIKALQKCCDWPHGVADSLHACRQGYIAALDVLHSAIQAMADRRTRAYVADMEGARSAPAGCEDAFRRRGAAPLLRREDEDAFGLATVAMLIARLLPPQ